ncbi:TRAP transporter substrate-binding protein DctP [Thermodesulfobacteriota bacterium]
MKKQIISASIIVIIFVFAHFFILPDAVTAAKRYMIKFASVAPEGSTWIKQMRILDKTLRKKSNGQIGLRIYAGGIAGDELDVLRKIRIGQIHSVAFSGVGIAQTLPMVRVLDLPFLFRNMEEVETVRDTLSDYFVEMFRGKGFEFLAWAEIGDVHLFSIKEIRKVDDLKGLKIWTWSGDPISKKTFSVLGSTPIPLSITDVTTALSTKMINTIYAPPLGAMAMQWDSKVKYMTLLPLAHSTGTVIISLDYFNKIPKELSTLLKVEIKNAMSNLTSDLIVQSRESIDLIQGKGVNVIPIPPEDELAKFYRVHDLVAKDLTDKIYPKELLDKVYDILKKARNSP